MALLDLPDLLTLEQAADFLRVDLLSIRRAGAAGELPLVRSDGRYLVDTMSLLSELGVPVAQRGQPQLSVVDRAAARVETRTLPPGGTCSKGASRPSRRALCKAARMSQRGRRR